VVARFTTRRFLLPMAVATAITNGNYQRKSALSFLNQQAGRGFINVPAP
jgi:hypothetical protein